jgi:hypothetical protein
VTQDEFENLLRMWGFAFGPRRGAYDVGPSVYGDSPLAHFGRARTIRQVTTMDRGGIGRRTRMGAAAGLLDATGERVRAVPTWAVEPVRGSQSRSVGAKVLATDDPEFSPEVMRVERAATSLQRADSLLGQVLRAEYCTLGGQEEKSHRFNLRRNAYRERLAEARGWVRRDLGT